MKALVKAQAKPGLWLQDQPEPQMGINDVLIKITKTSICGTDLHIYNWDQWAQQTIKTPMIVGHEFTGVIQDIGSDVQGLNISQRVSGEGHITCGYCRNCRAGLRHLCRNSKGVGVHRTGCFAEFLVIPATNVCPIPDNITDDQAAILDPLGNAVHTTLSFDLVGEDVLITGAGPIGIMAVSIAKKAGARFVVITDINDYRLNLAKSMGADLAININKQKISDAIKPLKLQEGFDVGLEVSGQNSALVDMIDNLTYGANLAMLGLPASESTLDLSKIILKGLNIRGIYGREMFETWYKMISLLQSGLEINHVITDHFHVDDYQQAFDKMLTGNSGKIILDWSS